MTTSVKSPTGTSSRRNKSRAGTILSETPSTAIEPASPTLTKAEQLIALLRRPEGASIAQMGPAVGWLPHSVRGFMADTLKKRHGIYVVSEKSGTERIYRIADAGPAA